MVIPVEIKLRSSFDYSDMWIYQDLLFLKYWAATTPIRPIGHLYSTQGEVVVQFMVRVHISFPTIARLSPINLLVVRSTFTNAGSPSDLLQQVQGAA